jgi:DNA-binding response OmpR family regulator
MWNRKLSKTYSVVVAESVPSGIDEAKNNTIDLILLDLRLNGPTSSGLQVFEFVRARFSEVPIFFITGLEFNEPLFIKANAYVKDDVNRGIKSQIIKKPIEIQTLVDEINLVLGS